MTKQAKLQQKTKARQVRPTSPTPTVEPVSPQLETLQLNPDLTTPYIATSAAVLQLQRKLGNQAVQQWMARSRQPVSILQRFVPTPTPATHHTGKELSEMSLSEFYMFAEEQVDWFNDPKVSDSQRRKLRTLLGFGARPEALSGAGQIKVSQLIGANLLKNEITLNESVASALESYGRAVAEGIIQSPSDSARTVIKWGKEIKKLYDNPGLAPILRKIMREEDLKGLIDRGYVKSFINYVNKCQPRLEASEGMEIVSYLAMRAEGKDPVEYRGTNIAGHVKNFHRFQRRALDRLIRNFGKADQPNKKRKPLTLIMHTATDHNGAFHRDGNLTDVITNNNILALMIEGKDTLADVQGELAPLAARYGKDSKIDQAMFAGHGNARLMELGGKGGEEINLDDPKAKAKTDQLFDELLRNMATDPATSPHRRIVFNACLTNSNEVPIPLDAGDPAKAGKQVRDHIGANASLATYLQQRIKAKGLNNIKALGANGSIGQVRLIDAGDGLDIIADYDPAVTADKLEYVKKGAEPGGVLRAVLECWAGVGAPDATKARDDCFKEMETRVKFGASADWSEQIIRTLFDIILQRYRTNGETIRQMADAAMMLDECRFKSEARVSHLKIGGLAPGLGLAGEAANIFKKLTTTTEWSGRNWIPLVINEVWMRHDGGKRPDFMSALSPFNCQTAADFLDIPFIKPELPNLLPLNPSPPKEQLLLAFRVIDEDSSEAHTRSFLLKVIGAGNRRFPAALNVNSILQSKPTEQSVLEALGLASGGAGPAPAPPGGKKANLDLDGDGTNETYVEPMRDQRGTLPAAAEAYQRPDLASTQLSPLLRAGITVYLVGEIDTFYAIHNPKAPRQVIFVEKAKVNLI